MTDRNSTTERLTHTPGPWRVKLASSSAGPIGYIMADTDHEEVAVLYGDNEANARLIAAAPDLLALLKDCRVEFVEGEGYDSLIAQIDAAIEKAEGAQ